MLLTMEKRPGMWLVVFYANVYIPRTLASGLTTAFATFSIRVHRIADPSNMKIILNTYRDASETGLHVSTRSSDMHSRV